MQNNDVTKIFNGVFFVTLLLFLNFTQILAEEISKYSVDVTIEASGELAIKETIIYDFGDKKKHGILREIPTSIMSSHTMKALGFYDFNVRHNGQKVAWKKFDHASNHAGERVRLKIGSSDIDIKGKHSYEITYRVKNGVLPAWQDEGYDAIRWNVIGVLWEVPIHDIEANFFLPDSLGEDKVAYSSYTGEYQSIYSDASSSWRNARHLQVTVSSLKAYQGVTVELAFRPHILGQDGLDNIALSSSEEFFEWFFTSGFWVILLSFLLYFAYLIKYYSSHEEYDNISIKKHIPKGLSILRAGLLMHKFTYNTQFAPAILELAQQGHIRIDQNKSTYPILTHTPSDRQTLTQEQIYLLDKVLFKVSDTFALLKNSSEKASQLKEGFAHINRKLYAWAVDEGYFEHNPQQVRKKTVRNTIFALIPLFFLTLYTFSFRLDTEAIVFLLLPLIFFTTGLSLFLVQKNIWIKLFASLFIFVGAIPIFVIPNERLSFMELLFSPLMGIMAVIILLVLLYQKIGKRSQKGAKAYADIVGLKAFIESLDEEGIEEALKEDPFILDKLLPYVILFELTTHWLSFYNLLNQSLPAWFDGTPYDLKYFNNSLNNASTSPSSSGKSSSGGFSAGGSGGGGGSSW